MITKVESEKLKMLVSNIELVGYLYGRNECSLTTYHKEKQIFEDFIESITEKEESKLPVTYSINWNKRGYLPDSEGYNGLENITDIKDAIISCLEDIVGDDHIEDELRQHDLTYICGEIQTWINGESIDVDTILFDSSGEFCVFIYKDETE